MTPATTPERSAPRRRRLLGALAVGALALGTFGLGSAPAGAAPEGFTSPVLGSLTLGPDGDPLSIPDGVRLTGTYDDETGDFSANLTWPVAVTQIDSPLGPLDATIQVVQTAPITGLIDPDTGEAALAAPLQLHLIDLSTPTDPPNSLGGGPNCRFPAALELVGETDGQSVEVADDDFTINPPPGPADCGALTALIADGLAGEGNSVDMTFSLSSLAGQVEAIYNVVLGRGPDPDGLAYWVGRLSAGSTPTRVAISIAREPEGWSNTVVDSYRIALDRDPDAVGRRYWTETMARAQNQPTLVGRLLTGSSEAQGLAWEEFPEAASGAEAYVRYLYLRMLDRAADEAGLTFWVDRIQAAADQLPARANAATFFYRSPEIVGTLVNATSLEICEVPAIGAHRDTLADAFVSSNYNTRVLRAVAVSTPCPEVDT